MHILFLTQVLPYPLDAGPKIRAYYTLRHLAQHHEITLVSFVRATDTADAIAHLGQFCRAVHTIPMVRSKLRDAVHLLRSLPTEQPFIIARDWVPTMAEKIAAIVEGPEPVDAIHADQLWMAPYALRAANSQRERRPLLVLDQHNAVYLIFRRLAESEPNPLKKALLALEWRKLARQEEDLCRQFDRVVWVTAEDYEAFGDGTVPDMPLPKTAVIPICQDTSGSPVIRRPSEARRITFLGGLHYPPNAQGVLWFAEQVLPKVLAQVPDAVLTVIGKQPPAQLTTLGIPAANLEITGYVDDPTPYLAETAAFVVPLFAGGGMRVKIIDAWIWGMPMISTSIGAEGIDFVQDEQLVIADTAEAFAQATVHLLECPERGQALAAAGRDWVDQHYNWRTVYQQWNSVYSK